MSEALSHTGYGDALYRHNFGKKTRPVALDLNALCSDRWQFADTCMKNEDEGMCISSIAKLMKCGTKSVSDWIRTARTFPPKYRRPEIAPSVYRILSDMPNPYEAIQFAVNEKFTTINAVQLRKQYSQYQSRSQYKRTGRPFVIIDIERFVQLTEEGKTDAEIAMAMGVSRATVVNYRQKYGIDANRGIGQKGQQTPQTAQTAQTAQVDISVITELMAEIQNLKEQLAAANKKADTNSRLTATCLRQLVKKPILKRAI